MAENGNRRTRLMIDVTPELRRRIKVAAASRDLSVRDYVVGILERAVPAGEEQPVALPGRLVTRDMIERFREIQARQGQAFPDDSTDIINESRMQRFREL